MTERVLFFLMFMVIVSGTNYDTTWQRATEHQFGRAGEPVCFDLPIGVTSDDDPQTKYMFYARQFSAYLDDDNAQHLLWGGGGGTLPVMYDIMIDDNAGINFTMTEVDVPFNSTVPLGFGVDVIEIHDIDGDNVNDLIVVSLDCTNGGPLYVLKRNEGGITDTFNIIPGDLEFSGIYKWGSLDYYSGDASETTFLFSIGGSADCGAWMISFSNEDTLIRYWEIAIFTTCEDDFGVSIARWIDFGNDGYDDIVIGSPGTTDPDGKISIFYLSGLLGDGNTTHEIQIEIDTITYDNEEDEDGDGIGNSISTIYELGDTIPRLAIGSRTGNYFLVLIANNDTTAINTDFILQFYSHETSGYGKSVTQVKNYDFGGSIGEIVIAFDDMICLYYLTDSIADVYTTTDITTNYSTTGANTDSIGYSTTEDATNPTTVTSGIFDITQEPDITKVQITASSTLVPIESNTEKTEEEICTIIQGSCTDGGVVITPPTNTSNGVNITDDVTINQNTTIKGSNVTVTGSITITGSLDIDSSSLDIKNKIDVSGDLNVGNSVLVFSNNGGTIKAGGCVTFASDSEIKIELTDEEKKQLAKNGEGFVLIESDCFEGEEKFTDASSSCENGVRESIKVNEDSMSVIFENCLEPGWIVFIILLIVGAVVVFLLLVLFTPLRTKIFPHRRENQEKDGTVRDNRVISRLTLMDTELKGLSRRTMHLKGELDSLSSYDSN